MPAVLFNCNKALLIISEAGQTCYNHLTKQQYEHYIQPVCGTLFTWTIFLSSSNKWDNTFTTRMSKLTSEIFLYCFSGHLRHTIAEISNSPNFLENSTAYNTAHRPTTKPDQSPKLKNIELEPSLLSS